MLIQICGLPGSGKTTLSLALADAVPSVLLRIDAIEASMWKYAIPREQSGIAAYSVAHAIAAPHLQRGQVVVADAVSAVAAARDGWRATAATWGSEFRVIEVVCPDLVEHRRRVEHRANDLLHFEPPSWEEVERVAMEYEPRHDDRLIIDSTAPISDNVARMLRFTGAAQPTRNGAGQA